MCFPDKHISPNKRVFMVISTFFHENLVPLDINYTDPNIETNGDFDNIEEIHNDYSSSNDTDYIEYISEYSQYSQKI